jgi:hypothetical protein
MIDAQHLTKRYGERQPSTKSRDGFPPQSPGAPTNSIS